MQGFIIKKLVGKTTSLVHAHKYSSFLNKMQSPSKIPTSKPFKERKSLGNKEKVYIIQNIIFIVFLFFYLFTTLTATRKSEVIGIKAKFPTKVPVCVF